MSFHLLAPILRQNLANRLNWLSFRPAQTRLLERFSDEQNLWLMGPLGAGKTSGLAVALADAVVKSTQSGISALYIGHGESRIAEIFEPNELRALVWAESTPAEQRRCLSDPPELVAAKPEELQKLTDLPELWGRLEYLIIDDGETLLGSTEGSAVCFLLDKLTTQAKVNPRRIGISTTVGNPDDCLSWLGGEGPGEIVKLPGTGSRRYLDVEYVPPFADAEQILSVKVRGGRGLVRTASRSQSAVVRTALENQGLRCQGPTRDCLVTSAAEIEEGAFSRLVDLRPPHSVSDLLNCVGLTRRKKEATSRISLVQDNETDFLAACAVILKAGQRWIEPVSLTREDWPAYLGQLIETILIERGVQRSTALRMGETCYVMQALSEVERAEVLDYNLDKGYLQEVDRRLVLGTAVEKLFDHRGWRLLTRPRELPSYIEIQGHPRTSHLPSWFLEAFPTLGYETEAGFGELRLGSEEATWQKLEQAPEFCWVGSPVLYHPSVSRQIHTLLTHDDSLPFLQPRQVTYLTQLRKKWSTVIGGEPVSLASGSPSTLYTFAGGRVNGLLARWHYLKTGNATRFNNLYIQSEALHESLKQFLNAPEAELQLVTRDLVTGPLHQFLPPAISSHYLRMRLYDEVRARRVAKEALKPAQGGSRSPVAPPERGEIRDPFMAQLHSLIREHPTRTKWVLVPERSLGWTLGERLLLEGSDYVNLRFTTPFELALNAVAPYLLEEGIDPRPEGLGPDLLLELLNRLPSETPNHFRSLAHRPRVGQSLWKAVQELRMAGLKADQIDPGLFQPEAKGAELRALLKAYEGYLQEHRLGDRALVYERVLKHLDGLPLSERDILVEYPSFCPHPVVRRFLDSLPGEHRNTWVHRLESVPRRWSLLGPERKVIPRDGESPLQFFCAGRRDGELHEVLRRLLNGSIPLDKAEVVVPDQETLYLLWDKLCKHGLPATFSEGVPATLTTPCKALLGLLQWCESGFSAFYLREMLLAGLLQPAGVSSSEGARFLEHSRVSWGRESYLHNLTLLARRYTYKDVDEEKEVSGAGTADKIRAFSDWVEQLLDKMSAAPEKLCEHLIPVLERDIPPGTNLDTTARNALCRVLKEIQTAGAPLHGLALIKERIDELRIGAGRPRPGHLHVTVPLKLGRSGRKHLYLVGLEAGSLIPDLAQDSVLSDSERRTLHPGLSCSTDRLEEYQAELQSRLSAVSGTITFSYSRRDYKTGEELLCSRFFFDTVRLVHPHLQTYDQLGEVVGDPVTFSPPTATEACSQTEWWLSLLRGRGTESQPIVSSSFPWLHRGHKAELARLETLFTSFDGWVPEAAGLLDPRVTLNPTSVSRLQSLAACPHRAFLETALGLSPLDLEFPDLDLWLDGRLRGTALHETFAAYHRELRREQRSPSMDDKSLLRTLLEEQLDLTRKAVPPPSEAVEQREVLQLQRDLDKFLALECHSSREVVACEVGFGLEDPYQEPFATLEPIRIELSEQQHFYLRGRIDRLDRVGPQLYEVVDYKTGRRLNVDRNAYFAQGRLLQHALYALVAKKLLEPLEGKARVQASSYYFPVLKAERDWVNFPYPNRQRLTEVMELVLEPLATGAFSHTDRKDKLCRFCDFRAACAVHRDDAVREKLHNETNDMLQSRRRLEEIK